MKKFLFILLLTACTSKVDNVAASGGDINKAMDEDAVTWTEITQQEIEFEFER